jgi:hypothetical protein
VSICKGEITSGSGASTEFPFPLFLFGLISGVAEWVRDTGWWRRVEPDLRPNKLVKIIVVQYDGVTIQDCRDILSGCF